MIYLTWDLVVCCPFQWANGGSWILSLHFHLIVFSYVLPTFINVSEPQLPHLKNEDNSYLTNFL